MARPAEIPKGIGEGLSRIASEGRTGIKEILLSIVDDLNSIKSKFDAHTHAGAVAVPAVGERPTIGTTEEL